MHSNTTSHFFTVDVEEYFQVKALESAVSREEWASRPSRLAGSIDALLETLDRHSVRGTFFVLGWIAKHRPEVVLAIASAGHEIASHGFWHERVTALDQDALREDVRSSKQVLEDLAATDDALRKAGMTVTTLAPEERQRWLARLQPVYDGLSPDLKGLIAKAR